MTTAKGRDTASGVCFCAAGAKHHFSHAAGDIYLRHMKGTKALSVSFADSSPGGGAKTANDAAGRGKGGLVIDLADFL